MSVTVLDRPALPIYNNAGNPFECTFTRTANLVLVSLNVGAHGLIDGQWVYIKCPIEHYNGHWVVDTNASATTFVLTSPDDTFQQTWIQDTEGEYYVSEARIQGPSITATEGYLNFIKWNSVHLPILYRLSNNLWPVNSADTVRTISSVTNSNDYCALALSGDIKASGSAAALDHVKITNANDSSFNGVYQIIAYTNDTTFSINLAYSAANDAALSGASIQYYYNNYNIRVRVYGGLPEGHTFEDQRPYEQISELKITPNSSNKAGFSISDILKSQITTDNNTLLSTLPNNINNWTGFYIEYAESYDVVTSGVIHNDVSSYTSDKARFEGYAVNSELPFKNVYSGTMSEYVLVDSASKFLTLFVQPVKFTNKYFDIGFISDYYQSFENQPLEDFTNNATGTAWTLSATPSVTLADGASSQLLSVLYPQGFKSGVTYRVAINLNYVGASTTAITASIESAPNTNVNFIQSFLNPGTNIYTIDLTAAGNYDYLVFRVVDVAGAGGGSYGFNNYWIYPLDDSNFSGIQFNQGGTLSSVPDFDQGVYRVQLSEPSCSASSTTVSFNKETILPMDPPGAWTDDATWTSKTFTQFNLTDAVFPPGPSGSHTALVAAVGQKVKFPVTASLIGTVNGSVGFSMYLFNGGVRSNEYIGLLTPASSPQTFEVELTVIIGASAEIFLTAGVVTGATASSGTVNLTLTFPETYRIVESDPISETKTIKIDCNCAMPQSEDGMVLSWLNYLGGYDHWFFTTEQEKQVNVLEVAQTEENIFPNWPNSYGTSARGITRQTYRKAKNRIKLTSQLCTLDELKGLQYIRTSPVVTITNSIYDTRVIIIDDESFTLYKQGDKQYFITFYGEYTDFIPSQRR